MNDDAIRELFKVGVRAIGIDEKQRQELNLTFHSWRHFYNSMLRGKGIPDHVLRKPTGHRTEEMTDRYSHVTEEQKAAVARLADVLVM